ncbi:MAG: metallophosphoesterase [Methanoregula sp.]
MLTGSILRLFFLIGLISCVILPVPALAMDNPITYSIVHLSDTQNLATYYPDTYNLTFSGLESRRVQDNISAVIITGDLVNVWNKKNEWNAYLRARNQTSIPVFAIAGNHDTDSGKNYQYYTLYTGEPKNSYVTSVGDCDLVGINYEKKTLPASEFSRIRSILANSTRSCAIIATHWYMNKDKTLSPLGKDIDKDLIVKPTVILMGHIHTDFVQQRNISGFPVVEDMTNYQNGIPGGNRDKNYSAGTIYTVTSASGQVTKITARVIHIFPSLSFDPEKIVFERDLPVPVSNSTFSVLPIQEECSALDLSCGLQALAEQNWSFISSLIPG